MSQPAQDNSSSSSEKTLKKPSLFGVIQSVLAAMFGVQSDAKREQDFEKGSAGDYIFVGIIAVAAFVLGIMWIVNTIVNDYNAGG